MSSKTAEQELNGIKPRQAVPIIKKLIEHNEAVLLVGPPGVGKTDLMRQACEQAGADILEMYPVVSDPTDIKGLPVLVDGKAEFSAFGEVRRLFETDSPLGVILDDLGQAPTSVQAAFMNPILSRQINGRKISDKVTFLAATNRKEDKAGVAGLIEPLKSRFLTIINIEPDIHSWTEWATANHMPSSLTAFLNWKPQLLHKFEPTAKITNSPSPRTAAHVGRLLKMDFPQEVQYDVIAGAAGPGFATELIAFITLFADLPDPKLILANPEKYEPPEQPDRMYALAAALADHVDKDTGKNFFKCVEKFPDEFAVMMIYLAVGQHNWLTKKFGKEYIAWANKHQDAMLF